MFDTVIWMFTAGIIVSQIRSVMQLREDIARMKATIDNIVKRVGLPDPISDELKEALLELTLKGEKVKQSKNTDMPPEQQCLRLNSMLIN